MIKNQIIQGDVIDIIKTLLAESINCIITSPPYFGLRNYGLPPTHWPEVTYAPMDGLPSITIPAMSCCLGLEDSIAAYVGHMVLVFRGLWRALRDDGTVFLNLGDSYASNTKGDNRTPEQLHATSSLGKDGGKNTIANQAFSNKLKSRKSANRQRRFRLRQDLTPEQITYVLEELAKAKAISSLTQEER